MNSNVIIRVANQTDAESLLNIYAPYVKNTAITFEYEVPTVEEFSERIGKTQKKYPYLLAEKDGIIVGYAYANSFHARAAFQWAVETSIYISKEGRGEGIGRLLYTELENALKKMGIINMYACIGDPEVEDEHLTKDSEKFHQHMGFRKVGEFPRCGFKFQRWYGMIWMEKMIGEHTTNPAPIRSYIDEI